VGLLRWTNLFIHSLSTVCTTNSMTHRPKFYLAPGRSCVCLVFICGVSEMSYIQGVNMSLKTWTSINVHNWYVFWRWVLNVIYPGVDMLHNSLITVNVSGVQKRSNIQGSICHIPPGWPMSLVRLVVCPNWINSRVHTSHARGWNVIFRQDDHGDDVCWYSAWMTKCMTIAKPT
jgi:hypothetical protein